MKKFNILQRIALFKVRSKKTFRIMKLTTFLLSVTILNAFANNTYSQNTLLNLNMKDVPMITVFKAIEDQSEFFFMYSSKMIDIDQKVDINVTDKKITEVLDKLLANSDIIYSVRNRQILLVNKESALELQQKKVTGTITDVNKQPVAGANVVVKGTSIGAITDVDGKYTIEVPPSGNTLTVSFIGYISQDVQIGTSNDISVTLQTESLSLNEVVVVGYGTVLKKNITTSISKVSTDDIPKASTSNVAQLLLGRASGLQATMVNAQPGGNINISIRGGGTPVYIVDGIMMPSTSLDANTSGFFNNVDRGGLLGLNPEDIESVEVLKDASASIYGIGASQGVILITTKKGKEGTMKINYDGSYSVVTNYKYPAPLNAQQYMDLSNTFNKEQYLYLNNLAPYGPTAYTSGWTAPFDAATIANAKTTDWLDMVLRDGSVSNHNLTFNGGNNLIKYYVSGNYFDQVGSVSNSSMERYSLRSNIVFQLSSRIKFSSIVNVNRNNYNNSDVGGGANAQDVGALIDAMVYPPYLPLRDANGAYTIFRNVANPVSMEEMLDRTASSGAYLNFSADFTIIKNMLTANVLFGDNLENSRRTAYIPSDVYFGQEYLSRGNLQTNRRDNQTLEATMVFNKKFENFLNFDAVIGVGKYLNKYDGMNVSYNGQYDAIGNDNLGAISGLISPGSYNGVDEKRSQFARLNFDFLDRYVIATTLRRDGTDKFFPGNKYAFFPSVSVAWKLSNESFMKSIAWINLVKLRVSYGETGSDNLGSVLYGTYGPAGNYVSFNGNTQTYVPIIQNGIDYPNVSWEKTTMKNVGMDFSIFKDRISGNFDVFMNDITDMLGNANTPGLSMYATYPINGAHLRRQGWDANFNTKNIQSSNFSWTSVLNLSRYNSLWISRMPGYDYLPYEKKGVAPSNAFYYYETNGICNSDLSNVPASQPAAARVPGYPIIVDKNHDGQITVDDVVMDNEVPELYLGFGNTFNYKNFDLDIFMYSQVGVKKFNDAQAWASARLFNENADNQNHFSYDIWNSLTNTKGTLPGIAYELAPVALPGGAGLDIGYQNCSFVRVRNITFGYNFTNKTLGPLGKYINDLRVYLDAQNPLTFTKFTGFDPEIYTETGVHKAEFPITRTFTFGVKVTFK
jgi:TonB-dependent starch-binding outer membrane protein SusC